MSDVQDDNPAADSSLQSMPSHRSDWKQHDLLANVLRRYFYVSSSMSGGFLPSWVVSPKDGMEIDDCLDEANAYLKK